MVTFDIRRTRIAVDASGFSGLTDALTGEPPINWKGNASQYEVGFFWGLVDGVLSADNQIVDVSAFQSITMEVKLSQGTPENVMAKTLVTADFDAITVTTWNDKSAQHCTFSFTDIQSNVPAAEYYLVFSGITASGNVVTLGAGQLTIREDGTPQTADDPAPNPGAAISLAQADARYSMIGASGVALGETSSTAYRGDRGKTAYDHSQLVSGNPHGSTAADVGAATIAQGVKADSAVQPGSLGSAAFAATTSFDAAGTASGLITALGLGTASTHATAFFEPAIVTDTGWNAASDNGDRTIAMASEASANSTCNDLDIVSPGAGTLLHETHTTLKALKHILVLHKFPNA